jgi:NAD(P)-dependent dehydrogenase (short-subunit alcohol dehydrogenase family)
MNGGSGFVASPGAALVTGAAMGIGRKIAERLALARYSVVLHCSLASRADAEAAAASIKEQGGKAVVLPSDLREEGALARLAADAAAIFGPLTLLVNNAAIFEADDAASFDLERWEKHFSVNLRAPVVLSRDFAGQLPDGIEGAIVNIIDQRVLRPTPQFFTYNLSKSALWAATRTMAQAFAPKGIRVNAVGPGPVSPNFNQGEAGFAREVRGLPLARAISPGEVAGAVLYLATDRTDDRGRRRPASRLANTRRRALKQAKPAPDRRGMGAYRTADSPSQTWWPQAQGRCARSREWDHVRAEHGVPMAL